jgi:hypothetical protein
MVVVVQGRWQPWTRNADTVVNAVMCVLFTWIVSAPIFRAAPTDQLMRLAIVLSAVGGLAIVTSRVWQRFV